MSVGGDRRGRQADSCPYAGADKRAYQALCSSSPSVTGPLFWAIQHLLVHLLIITYQQLVSADLHISL
jgi:hypothetical protein